MPRQPENIPKTQKIFEIFFAMQFGMAGISGGSVGIESTKPFERPAVSGRGQCKPLLHRMICLGLVSPFQLSFPFKTFLPFQRLRFARGITLPASPGLLGRSKLPCGCVSRFSIWNWAKGSHRRMSQGKTVTNLTTVVTI